MVNIAKFIKDNDIEVSIRYDEAWNDYVIKMVRYPLKIENRVARGFVAQDIADIEFENALRSMLTQLNKQQYYFNKEK